MKAILYKVTVLLSASCFALAAPAQVIKISAGTQVVNHSTITLQNINLVNDGVFSNPVSGSHIKFSGGSDQTVSGTGTTSFYSLTPEKNGAKILFQKSVSLAGAISMGSGIIDLTNSTMTLLPTAAIYDEVENSRITASGTGELVMTVPVNNVSNFEPGRMGITLTTQSNLGLTTFRRGHQAQTMGGNSQSIQRYFSIEPTNNSGINASLQFRYFDVELNGVVETDAYLFEKAGAAQWQKLQSNTTSNATNIREKSGFTSLHRYTLFAQAQAPLPLQLLAFNVSCKNADAVLQWITANEVNTKEFIIEKSENGTAWAPAQNTTAAQGNTAQHTYSTTVASNGAAYYRLKMEDKDAKFTYSPVKRMDCNGKDIITVGPNPCTGPLNISFQLAKKDNGIIQLLDAKGSLLQSRTFNAVQGLSVETVNMSNYPLGTYFIKISSVNGLQETKQIVKQ